MGNPLRIGHGYDLHRLEPPPPAGRGRPLLVGGVPLDSPVGPVAHSDGDALMHAITDAILAAAGLPDIGELFPDNDPANKGRDSAEFLREAVRRARDTGWRIANVDATLILERPRLSPAKDRVRARLAEIMGVGADAVSVKGKSHEGVDAVGRGEAIEAHAVALLARLDDKETAR